MFTKKHYKAIAKIVDRQTQLQNDLSSEMPVSSEEMDHRRLTIWLLTLFKERLVEALSDVFADDNPNFNRDKFKDACGVDGG